MITCLALSFDPTFTAGLNKDMNFVKKFKVNCDTRPSAFAYPKRLTEKKEEEKKVRAERSEGGEEEDVVLW